MPRYFFDLNDGAEETDELGTELNDPDAAWRQALRIAANFVLDWTRSDEELSPDKGAVVVRVRDEAGVNLSTVHLVVTIEGA